MTCELCAKRDAEYEVVGGGRARRACDGCLPAAQKAAGTPRSTTRIQAGPAVAGDEQADLFGGDVA